MNKQISKLKNKKAIIAIIGLGYVGLPLALAYINAGFKVIGFDIDSEKIKKLNNGKSYIQNISSLKIKKSLKKGFKVTSSFSKIISTDAVIICVPTPLNKYREPDLSFVTDTVDAIVPHLKSGHLVSLESTTYPGTTGEEILPRIESNGLKVGKDIFLIYSPEREDPGNLNFKTESIPKIVGGYTAACLKLGKALYEPVISKVITVSSTKVAEMVKLLENIYRAVNIGLVNEMKIISDSMGINIHEVISAASTKPFGFTPFYPGPGLGGHCIPIDPFYLTWKAKEFGINTRFIELAGEINTNMPKWVLGKTIDALNERKKPLKKAKILILGIAYKKNVDDTRESPGIELIKLFLEKGATVHYSDPFIPVFPKMRKYSYNMLSVKISQKKIASYDAIVLSTNHDKFNYPMIQRNAKLIIDTRGVFKNKTLNLVSA